METKKPSSASSYSYNPKKSIDFSQFSTDHFDAIAWINATLNHLNPSDSLSEILSQIQNEIVSAHSDIDSAVQEALLSLPIVLRGIENTRQMAFSLQEDVHGLGERVSGVETGAVDAVATIASAEKIVRRVEESRDLLRHALEAHKLSERLQTVLESGQLKLVAEIISLMRNHLVVLNDVPEMDKMRNVLRNADQVLEKSTGPKLVEALQARDSESVKTVLDILKRSGRSDVFISHYVAYRKTELHKVWYEAWTAKGPDSIPPAASAQNKFPVKKTIQVADLLSKNAVACLNIFYEYLSSFVDSETNWLDGTIPEYRNELISILLHDALISLDPPISLQAPKSDTSPQAIEAVHETALKTAAIAKKISKIMVSDNGQINSDRILAAVQAILQPFFYFVMHLGSLTSNAVVEACSKIPLEIDPKSTDFYKACAKIIENASNPLLQVLELVYKYSIEWSCGIGIRPALTAINATSIKFRDSFQKVMSKKPPKNNDNWEQLQGALRLLTSLASHIRTWCVREESLPGEAIPMAAPLIEVVNELNKQDSEECLQKFTNFENPSEAAVFFCLMRDETLCASVISEIETGVRARSSASGYKALLQDAKRIVYECMFEDIRNKLLNMPMLPEWKAEADEENENADDMAGFNAAPLPYAGELGEHLMLIPQKLEPFVPDDSDAYLSTPQNPRQFSFSGGLDDVDIALSESDNDYETVNFAGRWIAAVANGTMDLLVEKICEIPEMSSQGVSQLSTDLEYLCNVIGALGVFPTKELTELRQVLDASNENFATLLESLESDTSKNMAKRIAKSRKIPGYF